MPYVTNITSSEYPVKAVTIFKTTAVGSLFGGQPSSAEIVRSFPVELKPGENIVKVHGLSSVIDTESARVSGLPDGVSLFDIVCKHTPPKPLEPDSVEEEIRVLNTRKETLNSEKRVRGHEADILVNYGKSLSGEHASPEIAATFLNTFISNGKQNIEAIAKIDEELVQIDRKIAQIREQQKEKVGHARAEVSVTLAARKDVSFEMKLTYRTRHVSWTANYDLHATTEAGQPTASVNLHYRAKIHQSTGEDWKDTTLTLSTASADSYSKGLPTLKPLRITPVFNAPHKAYYNPNNHPGGSAANTGAPAPFSYQARPANAIQMQVAPPPGGGFTTTLFGSQQMAQQSSSGGLFGSAAAQSSTIPPPVPPSAPTVAGGSLFGSSSAAAQGSAPATTGFGGFGGSATTTQGSARAAGLFGGHRANSSSQEPPSASDDEFEEIAPDSETLPEDRGDGDAQLDERKTIVQESALSTSFRVEGKVSVPSDGLPHQVLVAVIPFEAALTYVAIPRAEAAAYVQCEVKNTSEYRLLPGPVSVFLDESFVSKTSVQEVNTGDTFECTLGTDPLIGVTYSRSVRSGKVEGGSFSEKTRTVYYTTIAAIKNRHRFALPRVVVRDSIPLSGRPNALADEDNDDTSGVDRLRVILRKPLGLADAKDGEDVKLNASGAEDVVVRWMKKDANGNGGEKQGKFEWVAKVETGARVELRLEYEIKGGAETKWALRTTEK